jgi:hypothetical protein
MDYQKEIDALFDGVYHPEKNCFFCGERCENECARSLIQTTAAPFFLLYPSDLGEFRTVASGFLDLVNRRGLSSSRKLYMMFSFISWMSRYEILHYFLMLDASNKQAIVEQLKRVQDEYRSLEEHKKIGGTLFTSKLEHIISFLEMDGKEIKEPF